MAIYGVRKYIVNAKRAEATSVLSQWSKGLVPGHAELIAVVTGLAEHDPDGELRSYAASLVAKLTQTQGSKTADLCVGAQGTGWFHIALLGLPAKYAWASEITDGQHFPLRLVLSEDGVERGRLEVTSIDKKQLNAADFEVPAGYNVMDLAQLPVSAFRLWLQVRHRRMLRRLALYVRRFRRALRAPTEGAKPTEAPRERPPIRPTRRRTPSQYQFVKWGGPPSRLPSLQDSRSAAICRVRSEPDDC